MTTDDVTLLLALLSVVAEAAVLVGVLVAVGARRSPALARARAALLAAVGREPSRVADGLATRFRRQEEAHSAPVCRRNGHRFLARSPRADRLTPDVPENSRPLRSWTGDSGPGDGPGREPGPRPGRPGGESGRRLGAPTGTASNDRPTARR